jgi:hypothetical protein
MGSQQRVSRFNTSKSQCFGSISFRGACFEDPVQQSRVKGMMRTLGSQFNFCLKESVGPVCNSFPSVQIAQIYGFYFGKR